MTTSRSPAEVFSAYLNYWMQERGMDSSDVVNKARRKYGVLSAASMTNFLAAKPAEMMVGTVEALAYAIRRPAEEVFMAKIGHWKGPPGKESDIQPSELSHLDARIAAMPSGEAKRFVIRLLRMIEREIEEMEDRPERK